MWLLVMVPALDSGRTPCGGTYTATRGILQTPNFPREFPVPIKCEWIIKVEVCRARNTMCASNSMENIMYEGNLNLTCARFISCNRYRKLSLIKKGVR